MDYQGRRARSDLHVARRRPSRRAIRTAVRVVASELGPAQCAVGLGSRRRHAGTGSVCRLDTVAGRAWRHGSLVRQQSCALRLETSSRRARASGLHRTLRIRVGRGSLSIGGSSCCPGGEALVAPTDSLHPETRVRATMAARYILTPKGLRLSRRASSGGDGPIAGRQPLVSSSVPWPLAARNGCESARGFGTSYHPVSSGFGPLTISQRRKLRPFLAPALVGS